MNTRSIAASLADLVLLSVVGLTVVGCSTRTRVELQSASAPAVQPADGRDGQNDLAVVDAGVIEIDDQPIESTTTEAATTTEAVTTTKEPSAPTSTAKPGVAVEIDDSTKTLCRNEKRTLKMAIEDYRADQGTAPTSEGDLIAFAYLRAASDLYDVRVDGSVVSQGGACAGVR